MSKMWVCTWDDDDDDDDDDELFNVGFASRGACDVLLI
jgi:hypothetical protein